MIVRGRAGVNMAKANKAEPVVSEKIATIPCRVLPGMFSTERQVVITLPDGQEIDALVDRRSVVEPKESRSGQKGLGFVTVYLVNYDKRTKKALVDLPQGSFNKGPRIQIPSEMLKAI
jgi:hypothetical protein